MPLEHRTPVEIIDTAIAEADRLRYKPTHPEDRQQVAHIILAALARNGWYLAQADEPAAKVGRNSPDTSRAAAELVLPRTGTQRWRVLEALAGEPMTDEELQQHLHMNPSSERPRRLELVEAGLVTDSGERRCAIGRADAIVWKATTAGYHALGTDAPPDHHGEQLTLT